MSEPCVKHCVLLKFKVETAAEAKAGIFTELDGLQERNLGIVEMVHGAFLPSPSGPTTASGGYTDALVVTFRSADDRDRYNIDPEHQRILHDDILPNIEGGADGVLRFDFSET